MKWCLIVLIALGLTRADNAVDSADYGFFSCPELNLQEEIDLDKIMNKWYVVEILEHKFDPTKTPNNPHIVIDSCPIVTLRPHERSSLKLLWTEKAGNLEYTFQIPDISRRPGFWNSASKQNGSLVEKQYSQFLGTVHVMKAVASDMVLTFCSRSPDSQLYSLLLSREHTLERADRRGVHNLLGRRGLKIISIRETCANNAASRRSSLEVVSWTILIGLISSTFVFRSWQ